MRQSLATKSDKMSSAMRTPVFNAPVPNATAPLLVSGMALRSRPPNFLVRDLAGIGHRYRPPDARNTRCNSSSEKPGLTPSKMKRHRHSTVLEWHAPYSVVSYIHLYLPKSAQQRYVVEVSETITYRGAVSSANREGPQQRCHTVADDARLHNVRVDVDGIEPSSHVDHVICFYTEGIQTINSLCRRQNHGGRRCDADIRST